ncbi:heme transporter FLVCR2-like [Clytia hemisphaerica]|uniref:heme transporter FLVCR2-like n=1 Tax=Clytia hemisphaerica TaxID=252671 RepID=UPI0034D45CB6
MTDTEKLINSNDDIQTPSTVKVYKKRWLILLIFSINSMANTTLFTCITAINKIVCKYYHISPELTNWAGNIFSLVYVLIALPSAYCMDNFGIKTLLIIGSSLNGVCVCLHLAGTTQQGISFVMTGQIFSAFSVGAVAQIPSRLSMVWFSEQEYAKAIGLSGIFNLIGQAIGFLQPSYMVPDSDDMDEIYDGLLRMNISHVALLAVCLISAYLFFDEKPPLPPSYAKAVLDSSSITIDERVATPCFKQSLRMLLHDKNFMIFCLAFGIQAGLFNFFIICLNQMASHIANSKDIGWIGFTGNTATIIGVIVFASIVDKYKCYKKMMFFLFFMQILSWIAFSSVILYWKVKLLLFLTYAALCIFSIPFMAIGMSYSAELTYPISEGLSSGVSLMFGNGFGFLVIITMGRLIDANYLFLTCAIVTGFYTTGFLLCFFIKENLKRSNIELQKERVPLTPENT